jgi:hypothetical protein
MTRQTQSSSRAVGIVIGAVLGLAGLVVGAAGGILLGLFGSDGTLASGSHPISTSRAALVSSTARISDVSALADVVGDPSIRLTARPSKPGRRVFIGIGSARQVDRYLAGAPVDEVSDFEIEPFSLEREPRPGARLPEPPGEQSFWVAQATGADAATLRWKVADGDYRLVLMNADASRGVAVDGDFGLSLPHVTTIAWLLVGGGAALVAGGLGAVMLGARRSVSVKP